MNLRFLLNGALLPLLCVAGSCTMIQAQSACGTAPAILKSTQPNIFSEQQEQWLGEAMADQYDRFTRPVKNPAQSAYLQTIGDRLLAGLPPTKLKFHFTLVEAGEVNGFSLAGGQVYLTRKLVASAHSEDEIAGVIAHEMGHILTHQFAIETTADMRKLLGVTSVGDRADVYAKFQLLLEARLHQKHQTDSDSDDKQDQADRVAVYAAAAAGYWPNAYAEFWDRSFFVGGKTGSRVSDFLGSTSPTQKRLRRIRGMIAELPQGCGATSQVAAGAAFQRWQHGVVEDQTVASIAAAGGPVTKTSGEVRLMPALRMDIDRLRFSRDGKYILAQDESSIFVLSRQPFKEIFRFDAERAMAADFTPDSQEIVFTTPSLHVERWSIAGRKLSSAREVVAKQNCTQILLAPDGRTIACIHQQPKDGDLGFVLIDVDTGNAVFEKKSWVQPTYLMALMLMGRQYRHDVSDFIPFSLSGDGNHLLIGTGSHRLAFDLRTRTNIKLGGALKDDAFPFTYCFQGDDQVAAVNAYDPKSSGVFSFPEGKRVRPLPLPLTSMHSATGGNLVLTDGIKELAVALVDEAAGKLVAASISPALDAFGNSYVSENADGTLAVTTLGSQPPKDTVVATLSLSPLANGTSASLSPDGRYLEFSAHSRGAVWDLQTGKGELLVRGFRGAWWTPEGKLLGEYPPRYKTLKEIREITMAPPHAKAMPYKVDEQKHLESGHLLEWKQEKKAWTLTSTAAADDSVQWTRTFGDGRPSYTTNLGNSDLILSFGLNSSLGKDKVNTDAVLKEQAGAVKERTAGRVIEVVDSTNGTMRRQAVIEVPRSYEGVDGFTAVGELLYLSTGDNRTIVYSLNTGQQLRQFFGNVVAQDQASGAICTTNRRNEVTVLDQSGVELQHETLGSPLRFAALREGGTQLVVLTADQHVHRFAVAQR